MCFVEEAVIGLTPSRTTKPFRSATIFSESPRASFVIGPSKSGFVSFPFCKVPSKRISLHIIILNSDTTPSFLASQSFKLYEPPGNVLIRLPTWIMASVTPLIAEEAFSAVGFSDHLFTNGITSEIFEEIGVMLDFTTVPEGWSVVSASGIVTGDVMAPPEMTTISRDTAVGRAL